MTTLALRRLLAMLFGAKRGKLSSAKRVLSHAFAADNVVKSSGYPLVFSNPACKAIPPGSIVQLR